MALFQGEDLVDVQTPDGRSLRLPASVAASLALSRGGGMGGGGMPGGPSQPPPPPPQKLGSTEPVPMEIAGPAMPQQMPSSVTGGKLVTENPLENAPPPAAPKDTAAPSTPASREVANPPEQLKPVTEADLRKGGYAGGVNAMNEKLANYADAGRAVADTQAAEHEALGIAYEDQAKKRAEFNAATQAELEKKQLAQDKTRASIASATKKIADYKVDRSSDHPIINAIGIALAGLGQAMASRYHGGQVGENPAMIAFYKALDRKVAAQMGDLDKMREDVAAKRTDLQDLRQSVTDYSARRDAMWAGEAERARLQVLAIGERSKSAQVKAQAQQMAAELGVKSAETLQSAIDKQIQADEKKAQLDESKRQANLSAYTARRGQDIQKEIAGAELGYKYWATQQQVDAEAAKARASGDAAKAKQLDEATKDITQRAIGDRGGAFLLQPEGKKKMEQADAFEKQAQALEKSNPSAAQVYQQRAGDLRNEVYTDNLNGVFRMASPDAKTKFAEKFGGAQTAVSLADDIRAMAAKHGKDWLSTDAGRAAIQEKASGLLLAGKDAAGLGVLSKQDVQLMTDWLGGKDPTKMSGDQIAYEISHGLIGTDPQAFVARLEGFGTDAKRKIYNELQRNGYRGDIKTLFGEETAPNGPVAKSVEVIQQQGKNTAQAVENAKDRPLDAINPGRPLQQERAQAYVNNQGTGLNDTARAEVLNLVKLSRGTGDVAEQAKQQLGQLAADPALGLGVMHVLRDDAPDAYAAARASVPKGATADQLSYEEQVRSKIPQAQQAVLGGKSVAELAQTALEQDYAKPGSGRNSPEFKELSKQALTNPAAKAALKEITTKMGGVR